MLRKTNPNRKHPDKSYVMVWKETARKSRQFMAAHGIRSSKRDFIDHAIIDFIRRPPSAREIWLLYRYPVEVQTPRSRGNTHPSYHQEISKVAYDMLPLIRSYLRGVESNPYAVATATDLAMIRLRGLPRRTQTAS